MKPMTSFSMNFKTQWNTCAAIFLAVSFFLRVFTFTIVSDISAVSTAAMVFSLILPLLLSVAGMILLRALRLRHPLIYAVLGACLCIMVMCFNFGTGDVLRIILSVVWYLFCCVLLVGTALGYVPWNLPVSLALFLAMMVRILFYSGSAVTTAGKMIEFSTLAVLASLFCLTRCFRENT